LAALFIGRWSEARPEEPRGDFGVDFGLEEPAPRRSAPSTGGGQTPAQGPAAALLHVAGRWFRFKKSGPAWRLEVEDVPMQGCWAGSTDMLLRAVAYILADPDAAVPVTVDAAWAGHRQVGRVGGAVSGTMAVDLEGRGGLCLFVSSEGGDRLFAWNREKKALEDVTAAWRLASSSVAAAWGDFDGDGRLDLASWDGERVALWLQTGPGLLDGPRQVWAGEKDSPAEKTHRFVSPKGPKVARQEGRRDSPRRGAAQKRNGESFPPHRGVFFALSALDVGLRGRAGLLATTAAGPVLLTPGEAGRWAASPLPKPTADQAGADLVPTAACLAADFDGDDVCDVLLPLAGAALLYAGEKPGVFAAPKVLAGVGTGPGRAGACLGDFDADGLLDVFLATEQGCLLWQNRGGGRFEEMLQQAGEVAYIARPRSVACATGDVNNDGRQDVLILYADRPPQVFFNRGFRSFGHAHEVDLQERELLAASDQGQQAGLLADFTGDGAQDMALVLRDGTVWLFPRAVAGRPALAVRAALPVGGPTAGPIRVLGFSGDRALGAWNVLPGTAEAFFGREVPGPCRIRWRLPGGGPGAPGQERQAIAESGPVRVLLVPPGAGKGQSKD
jgi:hypothetical protein